MFFSTFLYIEQVQYLPTFSPKFMRTLYGPKDIDGKHRERAKWTKSRAVIGYPSGQDGAILPARDCPFCSRNNISPKSKQMHDSFLSQNIFRDSKTIFCHLSVGMELENEKTETRYHFCI